MAEPTYFTETERADALLAERDRAVDALLVAKCARWTMGTCPTRDVPENEWCEVCKTLDSFGYTAIDAIGGGSGVDRWERDTRPEGLTRQAGARLPETTRTPTRPTGRDDG